MLLLAVCGPGLAQSAGAAKSWSYEAVSVKPDRSGTDGVRIVMGDDEYSGENVRIINMVSQAYDIKQDLISGMPGWTDGAHFDVKAKLSGEDAAAFEKLSRNEKSAAYQMLLRGMLEERFGLKAHVETRQLPVYDLVTAKGGSKLKLAESDPQAVKGPDGKALRGLMRFQDGMLADQGVEISGLVGQLINLVHRMVVDRTGLTGRFNFALKFAAEREGAGDDGASGEDAPSLFVALEEQLGLKLQADKGPVETLVIDRVEQPTAN